MSDENVGGWKLVSVEPSQFQIQSIQAQTGCDEATARLFWSKLLYWASEPPAALSAHGQPVVDDSQRKLAQGLIEQLPRDHDGRNSWLLNHGVGHESDWLRAEHKRYQQAWEDWHEGYPKPTMRRYTGATP